MNRKEALHYYSMGDGKVRCVLCGHSCVINDSATGLCKVRRNIRGILYTLNYAKVAALAIDPIEKKPLYHFYPGSKTLSVALPGCNLKCQFCQNHEISQVSDPSDIKGESLMPDDIVKIAKSKNNSIISYTYSEPTVFYEYMLETAMLAKAAGINNVMVTNGFMGESPLEELLKFVDAFNVDLKSFRDPVYRKVIGGKLEVVLNNLHIISKNARWLEITTLVIPGVNNSREELEDIAGFIVNLNPDIPWHISAFHPDYNMTGKSRASGIEDLKLAYAIGINAGLKYVYMGNIPDAAGHTTRCYSCGTDIIRRSGGYMVEFVSADLQALKGKCHQCGSPVSGIF